MSPPEQQPSILVVDDDDALRTSLVRAFERRGFEARGASGGAEALAAARAESPELAVVDLRMPDSNGLTVVKELLALDPATRVVVLTGYGSIANAVEAIRLGAVSYLPKPADADDVLAAFARGGVQLPGVNAAGTPADPGPDTPSLARAEWEHINRVLADTEGNVSEAARRLGLHRRSLQRKLNKRPPRT